MRFMMIVIPKGYESAAPDAMPSPEAVAKMQEYNQDDLLSLAQSGMGLPFHKLIFQYVPKTEDAGAALNFHLTKQEKQDIAGALDNIGNKNSFGQFRKFAIGF